MAVMNVICNDTLQLHFSLPNALIRHGRVNKRAMLCGVFLPLYLFLFCE
jgi:hypothetical protein